MNNQRLSSPEQIRSGGFSGGVHVTPEQAPQGSSLGEMAQALSRLNPALNRAAVNHHTQRIDQLREDGRAASDDLIANELSGLNAQAIGEALEADSEISQRLRDNPYILPNIQVHRGRKAADETALSLQEGGINPTDREAVQEWLSENNPGVDDRFFNRGFNEQLERHRSQWTQRQVTQTLEDAERTRLEMGQTEFDQVLEDTGNPAIAFAALSRVDGVDPSERTAIQMSSARRLADAGQEDALEALLATARGDAPALERVTGLAEEVGTLRNRARIRREAGERDGHIATLDSLKEDLALGRVSPYSVENDPRYEGLPEEFRSQARGARLTMIRERHREDEQLARENEREQARIAREDQDARFMEAEVELDDMLASGSSFADVESSGILERVDPDRLAATRRRARNAAEASANNPAARRRDREAWEDQQAESVTSGDVARALRGELPVLEDVTRTDEEASYEWTMSARERAEAAVPGLREAMLGPDPWNQPEGEEARWSLYTQRLRQQGLRDPQLEQMMGRLDGLLTTEAVQRGSAADAEQVYRVFSQLDLASRSEFVSDNRTQAILQRVDRIVSSSPDMEFETALQTAVARYEQAQDMGGGFQQAFTRYERQLDYTLTDPETGREVKPETYRDSANRARQAPFPEFRVFMQDEFLRHRAAGHGSEDAAELANAAAQREFTVWNSQALRLPPRRSGGAVTGPQQWANAVDSFMEAEAFEQGPDDYTQLTITHLDNGVYAVTRPDGTARIAHAQMILAEAGDWVRYSLPQERRDAAREAGAIDTSN